MTESRGNKELRGVAGIAIVGSRKASSKALRVAKRLSALIVKGSNNELAIKSGFAKGIDQASHLGALEAGGNTVCVMPAGLEFTKVPSQLRAVMNADNTAFVSDYAGKRFSGRQAMERNNTIREMVNGVVVIESGITRSGTFAMGNLCLKHGTPLWVISPEDLDIRGENGNAELIKRGGMEIRLSDIARFGALLFMYPNTFTEKFIKGDL